MTGPEYGGKSTESGEVRVDGCAEEPGRSINHRERVAGSVGGGERGWTPAEESLVKNNMTRGINSGRGGIQATVVWVLRYFKIELREVEYHLDKEE